MHAAGKASIHRACRPAAGKQPQQRVVRAARAAHVGCAHGVGHVGGSERPGCALCARALFIADVHACTQRACNTSGGAPTALPGCPCHSSAQCKRIDAVSCYLTLQQHVLHRHCAAMRNTPRIVQRRRRLACACGSVMNQPGPAAALLRSSIRCQRSCQPTTRRMRRTRSAADSWPTWPREGVLINSRETAAWQSSPRGSRQAAAGTLAAPWPPPSLMTAARRAGP